MQDPQVQAGLDLDQTWRLTDELIAAQLPWLPQWLGGASPD
jgi:alpha-galactosidase/6-phospho-beta-glucosidase family protein